jgi:hypothetical protein
MQIEINQADLAAVKKMLSSVQGMDQRVIKRSVDRTMGAVKTKVSTVARETLNITKRDADPHIGVHKYEIAKNSGAVVISGASFPVSKFKPKQTATGVRVKIKKAGGYKMIPGAFIATVKNVKKTGEVSEHYGVFWRQWHAFKKPNTGPKPWKRMPRKYRLKIHEIFTSSLPDVVGDDIPMGKILADANVNLHKNIERELNYEMSRL